MITIANSLGNWSEALKVVINYKDGLIPVQMLGSRSASSETHFIAITFKWELFL